MATITKMAVKLMGDSAHLHNTLDKAESRVGRFASKVGGIGSVIAKGTKVAVASIAAIGLVAAGLAFPIAKIGMEYQDSLNVFQAVSGANVQQMQAVGDRAKQLGNDLTLPGVSAAGAATAMTELAKAGLSVEQSMAAAKGVLQLAKAAGVEEAEAATLAASALNAFSLSGDQAVRVADLLAAAANSSMGEITDMGYAMQMSASIFAGAGVSIEDLTASIAMMAQKGIVGSDAGTSLKSMLMRLTGPADDAAEAMNGLGIQIYDGAGKMRPYHDIIDNVHNALAGLTDAERNAAVQTIFGADAARAANIIFGQGVEVFDQMRAAVTKQGAAAEVAAAKSKGLSGAIENIKSTLETAAISIYEEFSPAVEEFVRRFTGSLSEAIDWAGRFYDKVKFAFSLMDISEILTFADSVRIAFGSDSEITKFANKLVEVRDKLLEVWNNPTVQAGIGFMKEQLPAIAENFGNVVDRLKEAQPTLETIAKVAGGTLLVALVAATGAARILSEAMSSWWGIIPLLTTLGIYYTVVGTKAMISAYKQVTAWTMTKIAAAKSIAETVVIWAMYAAQWTAAGAAAIAGAARQVAAWAMMGARAAAGVAIQVAQFALMIAGWIGAAAGAMASAVVMAAAWFIALGPIGWVIAAVVALVALIIWKWDWVKEKTLAAWEAVWSAIQAAWEWIKNAVSAAVDFVVSFIQSHWELLVGIVLGPLGIILALVISHWDQIKSFISGALSAIWGAVSGAFSAVVGFISSAGSSAYSAVAGAFSSMVGAVGSAVGSLVSLAAGIPGQILGAIGDLGSLLYNAGKNVIQGLIDGIGDMIGSLGSKMGEIAEKIRSYLPFSPAKTGPLSGRGNPFNSGRSIANLIAGGLDAGSSAVTSAMERLSSGVSFAPSYGIGAQPAYAGVSSSPSRVPASGRRESGSGEVSLHLSPQVIIEHPALEFLKQFIRFEFDQQAENADARRANPSTYRMKPKR